MTFKKHFVAFFKPKSSLEKKLLVIVISYLVIAFISSIISLIANLNNFDWWITDTLFFKFMDKWNAVIQLWIILGILITYLGVQLVFIRKMKHLKNFQTLHNKNQARFEVFSDLKNYVKDKIEQDEVLTGDGLMTYLTKQVNETLEQATQELSKSEVKPNE